MRKQIKIFVIIAGVFAITTMALHILFINNARGVLKRMVVSKSQGKLELQLSQLSFNFFSNSVHIGGGTLASSEKIPEPITYNAKFNALTLHIHSFWPLLVNKRLILDSITVQSPQIEVLRWFKDSTSEPTAEDLSITQEMGKVYKSMMDALKEFGIKRIATNNASLSLVNKMKPNSTPVTVSNIYLNVVEETKDRRNPLNNTSHSVDLSTSNQFVQLPGGRHNFSFKRFKLQLYQQRIQLDSCTITAISRNSKSSYSIFFKKLSLVGVDFAAMYQHNLIRADSVYCENPLFRISLGSSDNKEKKKDDLDPQKILRELTGDFDLAFVGVKNAGININIGGKNNRSLINSNKDNFEIRGLRINPDSITPVAVKRFDMLIQGYKLYNQDSTVAYAFDSIHFVNKKIILSNFSVVTQSGELSKHDKRDYRIPYFHLEGLDWYQLVFEQNVKAEEAVLYHPVINFTKTTPARQRNKGNFFSFLQSMDSMMTLNRIRVVNGTVNLNLSNATNVNLEHVNVSLLSNKLLQADNQQDLRNAVGNFSFSNGTVTIKDVTTSLKDVSYSSENVLHASNLILSSRTGKINASINDVFVTNPLLDEEREAVSAAAITWKNATIAVRLSRTGKADRNRGGFDIKNINGGRTDFTLFNNTSSISTTLHSLKISSLVNNYGSLHATGLSSEETVLHASDKLNKTDASIHGLSINQISSNPSPQGSNVQGLRWASATLQTHSHRSNISVDGRQTSNTTPITVRDVFGNNTSLTIINPSTRITTNAQTIRIGSFVRNRDNQLSTQGLDISGDNFLMNANRLIVKTGSYNLGDNHLSRASEVQVNRTSPGDTIRLSIPAMTFSADINSLISKNISLKTLHLKKPLIFVSRENTGPEKDVSVIKAELHIDSLTISGAAANITFRTHDSATVIKIDKSANSKIEAVDLTFGPETIKGGSVSFNSKNIEITSPGGEILGVENGLVDLKLTNVERVSTNGKHHWSSFIRNVTFHNPKRFSIGKNKNKLMLEDASFANITLLTDSLTNTRPLLRFHPTTSAKAGRGTYITSKSTLRWSNCNYNDSRKTFDLDSFAYTPNQSRDSVIANTPYQTDYITFFSNNLKMTGFDLSKLDSLISAESIYMRKPSVTIYRDKKPPFLGGNVKPLPAEMIKNIASPTIINAVTVEDGSVSYTERNAVTREEGTLTVTMIDGGLTNIKNRNLRATDSLGLNLNGYLMGSAEMNLSIKQSYADTLGGFLMNIGLRPTPLTFLNPVILPLSNVMITSGTIDSMKLSAVGKEDVAFGQMQLHYKNLKVKLVSNGDAKRSTFKNKLLSLIANIVLIKNNNSRRTGIVYFKRLPDKSFFNYILKMTFSGMASSIGIKKNEKYIKQYRETLNKNL